MRRREFITLLGGGAAATWPLAAGAQQGDRMKRIGVLMRNAEIDPEGHADLAAFTQRLAELGWTDGRNARMDIRWTAGNLDQVRMFAKELVGLQPDVILSATSPATATFQRETRTIPIVFVLVADPVGDGFVASVPRPGANITGFMIHEPSLGGKWLELLTEIAPATKRVAAMFNPDTASYARTFYLPSFEQAAQTLKVESIVAPVHNDAEIETVIASLGREPRGGLVVMPDSFMAVHRAPVISLAVRHNVPVVAWDPVYPGDGALLSYGPNVAEEFRRAAPYVDRVLRGAKPADLPVQLPVRFEMILNAKTAKALGLAVPPSIELRADRVIE